MKESRLVNLKTGTMFRLADTDEDDVYRAGAKYGDCENRVLVRNMKTARGVVFSGNLKVIPIPT